MGYPKIAVCIYFGFVFVFLKTRRFCHKISRPKSSAISGKSLQFCVPLHKTHPLLNADFWEQKVHIMHGEILYSYPGNSS